MDSQGNAKEETAGFSIIASNDDFGSGDTKICKGCGEEKPIIEFRRESAGVLGRKAKCKSCMSDNVRKKPNILDRQVALENAFYRAIKDGII